MEKISIRLKELRNQLQMSQVEFAKKLGVTNAHISKIEKGGTAPSDALIKLISKEYQVSEEWIKTGKEPMFIYEILEKTEEQLMNSTDTFNKLLSSDSYVVRGLAAELKFNFSGIANVNHLDEKQKIEYLTIVKKMLSLINQYNIMIKEQIYTKQILINEVKEKHFNNYKLDIEECINEYKKPI